MMSQVQLAQPVVDTAKEFKQAASGPVVRQDVSFDGGSAYRFGGEPYQ